MERAFTLKKDIVLTNYHVIEGTKYIELKKFDGEITFGKVIAIDIRLDLALIKTQARCNPLEIYSSRTIPLGEQVEAIGHPGGLEFSITRGVISAVRDINSSYMPNGKKISFIQTDAAINPGNSGGPLFYDGKVIGINTQKLAAIDVEGLGFAISNKEIERFILSNCD